MILSAVALFSCAHNKVSPRSADRAERTEPDTHSSFFSSVLSSVSSFLYGDPKKSREKMVSASTKNDLILRYTRWSNLSVRGREIAPRWIFVFCVVYIPSETGSRLRSLKIECVRVRVFECVWRVIKTRKEREREKKCKRENRIMQRPSSEW